MISIIICARHPDISAELKQNIEQTVGVGYEIIVIDNSQNEYTLFSAYNRGVALSRYSFLLFMHDDIHYITAEWGRRLLAHFENKKVGAIGVAGTHYLSLMPGAWWSSGVGHLHLLQSIKPGAPPEMQDYLPAKKEAGNEVLVLDGVWFCIRKELFDSIKFDETNFHGFHFYDVDTTLQVQRRGYRLLCVKDILIHHQSLGVLNKSWVDNAYLFNNKWKDLLPLSLVPYTLSEQCRMEYRVLNEFVHTQLQCGYASPQRIYFTALKKLLRFKKGWRFYQTPVWAAQLLARYMQHCISNK